MDSENKDIHTSGNENLTPSHAETTPAPKRDPEAKVNYSPLKPYPTWGDLWAIVGIFIGTMLLVNTGAALFLMAGIGSKEFITFVSYVAMFGITIVLSLYLKRQRVGKQEKLLNFSMKKVSFDIILWGVVLVFATSMLLEPLLELFPEHFMEFLKDSIGSGFWSLITAVVMAPLLEEALFRGIIQDSAMKKWGAATGIFASALVFGIIHIIPPQAINAFFIGLVLGYIYYKTQSLIPVIIIHAVNNLIAYLQMACFDEADKSTRELIGNDTVYLVIYGVCAIVFILSCVYTYKSIKRNNIKRENSARPHNNIEGDVL